MRDQIQALMASPGCDYLEIRVEDSKITALAYRGAVLEDLEETRSAGIAVRALVKGRWGFVSANDFDRVEQAIKDAIAIASASAAIGAGDAVLARVNPVDIRFRPELVNDPRKVSLEDKLQCFGAYNERMLSAKGITTSATAYFDKHTHLLYANSDGVRIDREHVDLACAITAIATRNGETRSDRVTCGSSADYGLTQGLEEGVDRAAAAAVAKLSAPVINAGTYTVVCDPELTGVFVHEAFGHLSEGDNVADDPAAREVLTLGRTFGGSFLNIYDTGLDKGLRGFLPYDDEGVPTQHTQLIRDGKLVGRLHNRESAAKLKEKPTGNARAINYRYPPIPRMRNTCIAPGPHGTFEDLIKDIDIGVYAVDAGGGQTNGELFTFTAKDAFMIRDGKVAERVKDVTISGNVFDTLRNIDAVSSDFHIRDSAGGCGKRGQGPLPVSHGGPHVRIRNCLIGGK